ncbi:MAG: hypothetical protein FJ387_22130 [Verrucomicrobia bacterium]|nr:hypothetical protein [Verrucomicrobiota bacterium]
MALTAVVAATLAGVVGGEPPPPAHTPDGSDAAGFAARAQSLYLEAKAQFEAAPDDGRRAWEFGRACFDWAEYATQDRQRASLAQEGIAACRALLERERQVAAAHYYLALNLGQLARTKTLGALKLVGEMEDALHAARDLDPTFDQAGPDRTLGLLYLDAPGWPASIGSRTKARRHLQQALELAPDFPDNHLSFIEAHLRWGERQAAHAKLATLDALWVPARGRLTGLAWASSWADWERRRQTARHRLATGKS